jgi:hypothetical protein
LLQAVKLPAGVPGGTAIEKEVPGIEAVVPEITIGTHPLCAWAELPGMNIRNAKAAEIRPTKPSARALLDMDVNLSYNSTTILAVISAPPIP